MRMEGRAAVAAVMLLTCCRCVSALNPSLDINQYAHTAWTVREGFFKGLIYSIAQTPDGYLWLGTGFGLLRFDGVRNVPWPPPGGEALPSSVVRSLRVARDGRLWIGTDEGLASWKDNKLARYPELAGQSVVTLFEDREGTIWAGGQLSSAGRLCAIQSGGAQCYGEDGRFGRNVTSLYEDSGGNLWTGTRTGLWRWKPGPPTNHPTPDAPFALIEGDNGGLWIAMHTGIWKFDYGRVEPYPLPGVGRSLTSLLRDRSGGLWIGTQDRGLLHVHQGRTDVFARTDGLSGDHIEGLFEDREGNIWVATRDGLGPVSRLRRGHDFRKAGVVQRPGSFRSCGSGWQRLAWHG